MQGMVLDLEQLVIGVDQPTDPGGDADSLIFNHGVSQSG